MHGVVVPDDAGVVDQVAAGEGDDTLRQSFADGHVLEAAGGGTAERHADGRIERRLEIVPVGVGLDVGGRGGGAEHSGHDHAAGGVLDLPVVVGRAVDEEGRVRDLGEFVPLIGQDGLGHHGAASGDLAERIQRDVAGQAIPGEDGAVVLDVLVRLQHAREVVPGGDPSEQFLLREDPDEGEEGGRRHQGVVAALGRTLLGPVHGMEVPNGFRVLAHLLAADFVVVVGAVVIADHVDRVLRGVGLLRSRCVGQGFGSHEGERTETAVVASSACGVVPNIHS